MEIMYAVVSIIIGVHMKHQSSVAVNKTARDANNTFLVLSQVSGRGNG